MYVYMYICLLPLSHISCLISVMPRGEQKIQSHHRHKSYTLFCCFPFFPLIIFSFYIPKQFPPSLPFSGPLAPLSAPESGQCLPWVINKVWHTKLMQDQVLPLHQGSARYPIIWDGLQKSNSCNLDQPWSHYKGPHNHIMPHNCRLLWSQTEPPIVCPESMNFY